MISTHLVFLGLCIAVTASPVAFAPGPYSFHEPTPSRRDQVLPRLTDDDLVLNTPKGDKPVYHGHAPRAPERDTVIGGNSPVDKSGFQYHRYQAGDPGITDTVLGVGLEQLGVDLHDHQQQDSPQSREEHARSTSDKVITGGDKDTGITYHRHEEKPEGQAEKRTPGESYDQDYDHRHYHGTHVYNYAKDRGHEHHPKESRASDSKKDNSADRDNAVDEVSDATYDSKKDNEYDERDTDLHYLDH